MFFFLSERFSGQTANVKAGDVLNITSFIIGGQSKKFAILSTYSVVRSFSFILYTPLSIDTVPKDLTPQSFEQYLLSVNGSFGNYPDSTSFTSISPPNPSFQSSLPPLVDTPLSDPSFPSKRAYPSSTCSP